ncbi:hypothetical protein QGP82_06195 [Leptothoe sp. LEGE 181152]|nr:hypothetical protein [Leptothoe sp. LEGE 181152]
MQESLKLLRWAAIASLAWGAGSLYNVYGGGETSWLRSMYQRKIALAQTLESPKLIVTGGSGAHYTINAEVLEADLGLPVINMGIDGPVGLNLILPSVLPQVEPGDTVLLIPEYLLLNHENGLGERSGAFALATGQPLTGNIPPKQLAQNVLMLGVPSLRAVVKSSIDLATLGRVTGYYDDPLTDQGDPTITKVRTGEWWQMKIKQPATPYALDRIAEFRQEVEAKGATLLLALPWVYADADDLETQKNVEATATALSEIAPLIYDPETFNIQSDSTLFADTHYHLMPEARRLRSQTLAQQLQPLLAKEWESNSFNFADVQIALTPALSQGGELRYTHISAESSESCITPLNPPLVRGETPVLPLTKGGLRGVRQPQTLVSNTCVYMAALREEARFKVLLPPEGEGFRMRAQSWTLNNSDS